MKLIFVLLLATWAVCGGHASSRYDGYKVYRMMPSNQEQKDLLQNLSNSEDLDFWTEVNNLGIPVDVMVKPQDQNAFNNVMLKNGMYPEVYIENVQELIDSEDVGNYRQTRAMTWTQYYSLTDIQTWLRDLATQYPSLVTVVNGGSTYEGRQITGVRIAYGTGKRVVIIEGGIHAREWIAPATVTWIINEILTSTDPTFRKIAESFEWHLFPNTNPDGYVYSHNSERLWRKTRTPYSSCRGADPNRNWAAHWMEQGSSNNPCSDTYAGPRAFSEVETSSFSNYIRNLASRMDVYISFHSYSQLLLIPYGHTTAHLDNYNQMIQICRRCATDLARRYGTQYKYGNIGEAIYLASGGSIDWVKQEFKTPVVLCYELRDTGRYGFLLPTNQIIPNNQEVIDSMIGLFQEAETLGYVTLG